MANNDRTPTIIGLNIAGHDTSAAILKDGAILAACEQERYSLEKHSRQFPTDAINDCLKIAGTTLNKVDEIAVGMDPMYYIRETYLKTALVDDRRIDFLINDIERIKEAFHLEKLVREKTGFEGKITFHQHHLCHAAGAYFPSGFENALIFSNDGTGEIETGILASGVNGKISILDSSNRYPNSLGLLYSAITFYLGWKHHCDEGIIMGLAPFGDAHKKIPGSEKTYEEAFDEIVIDTGDFSYAIDLSWIAYHHVRDTWVSEKFTNLFGKRRLPAEPLQEHHKNIAAGLQICLEKTVLRILSRAKEKFGFNKLAISGGVGLNCSLNGKIASSKLFDEIYVQPASGDSGVAVGACYAAFSARIDGLKPSKNSNSYLGSRFTDREIEEAFAAIGIAFEKSDEIEKITAKKLSEGKIVGWFQGAAEFGPRALGNRSILVKPFPEAMRDYLNKRVKFREEFRPFAPAVLNEFKEQYFEISQESPHMLLAVKATEYAKDKIPAVIHVDNSCRVQTVNSEGNPRFRKLLEEFNAETACPVLLNTSFNVKGQPIVNTPEQAIKCYLSTNIDFLVVGSYYSEKIQ